MKVLVTGAAGFIGMHVCERLLARGDMVVGVDNFNGYYEVELKEARARRLAVLPGFRGLRVDIADREVMAELFTSEKFDAVVHLAAQAGVRYSIKDPHAYADSNLLGFVNVLEGCRHSAVKHLVYASSSSVYGGNTKMPLSEHDNVDHPISLYAATKKANELMAHTYSHLYGLPTTGLRFFTVYGPWGRPDMAPFLFIRAVLAGRPIDVFNHGKMQRDFTYIDDIVEGVVRILDIPPHPVTDFDKQAPDPATSWAPYRVCNIGNNRSVGLMDFIGAFEAALGLVAKKNFLPMQDGDVVSTCADIDELAKLTGFVPVTKINDGIARFVDWYRNYYGVLN